MWITSKRVLPIIMLVVIPFSVTILAISLSAFFPIIVVNVVGVPYAFSYIYLISVSSLVFSFYPIKFRIIERRGFSNLLIEHACIKKILYFEIPILFAIMSMFVLLNFGPEPIYQSIENFLSIIGQPLGGYNIRYTYPYSPAIMTSGGGPATITLDTESGDATVSFIFYGVMINLGFSITAGIIWMILVAIRKELGYYLAKSIFQTIAHEREQSKKAEYFIKATKLYDKYLRRTLNLEINDAKRIYSKILSDSNLDENESLLLISNSFDSNNKLEPIKTLSKIMSVKETETFLVDESIGKKIKDMAIFFATIIPVVITIIQFMLQRE